MDLTVSIAPVARREFTAVVLAGFGAELTPLTSDHGDTPCPKALLPVGNRALLDYVLAWIEAGGVKDVVLMCPTIHKHAISNHIHSALNHSLHIDLQTLDETVHSTLGTAALLKHAASRIPRDSDFVVLPCDWVAPPTLTLTSLLDKFRADTVADGCVATACWYAPVVKAPAPSKSKTTTESGFPEEWSTDGHAPPAIVWDAETGTLLHVDTPDDTDLNAEELEVGMNILSRFPHPKLSSRFRDSHIYVCKRGVLDLLCAAHQDFESLREEFFPWLCKLGRSKRRRAQYADAANAVGEDTLAQALAHSTVLPSNAAPAEGGSSESDDAYGGGASPAVVPGSLKVGVVICRQSTARRVRTLGEYYDANRTAMAEAAAAAAESTGTQREGVSIEQRTQLSTDTLVGPSTTIGERTTIKSCVIGSHCKIGNLVKLTGSVLLDHTVVEDGAKVDGSVLGRAVKVGAKATVRACVVQAGYEVGGVETLKGERVEVGDWMGSLGEETGSESEE
ncbi:UDP-3-O-glucosamine N-acyltransferase [Cylindrobasidium torrendii FP15055 ss-10]|uniref:Translation initiation factor eIF2B subunit gamma n=1 Tax=Cylindrobasidium torrendii FP15055 ss-10 TaxID=1314674 RepID=A0A0D7AXU7_9AGAR|nr:UDP-3-O-glucosamine N-acyltransferase [Cylindrobasidium torrendii FP15055 ss-10]